MQRAGKNNNQNGRPFVDSSWAGVWVMDKPGGMTSAEVLRRLKKKTGPVRMGHTGTLDPLATGVLPVCIGEATKLLNFMVLEPKVYRGSIRLGVETDSWDITGKVVSTKAVPLLSLENLRAEFAAQEGRRLLDPPVFSAIKLKGKPLYAYARAGQTVKPAPREVFIKAFRLLDRTSSVLEFELVCGRGTYVRAVVQDLGKRLGCGACLLSLRRVQCGRFHIDDAFSLEQMEDVLEGKRLPETLLPPAQVLSHLESFCVEGEEEQKVRNGNRLRHPGLEKNGSALTRAGEKVRVMKKEELIAVAEIRDDGAGYFLQPVRVLNH